MTSVASGLVATAALREDLDADPGKVTEVSVIGDSLVRSGTTEPTGAGDGAIELLPTRIT